LFLTKDDNAVLHQNYKMLIKDQDKQCYINVLQYGEKKILKSKDFIYLLLFVFIYFINPWYCSVSNIVTL